MLSVAHNRTDLQLTEFLIVGIIPTVHECPVRQHIPNFAPMKVSEVKSSVFMPHKRGDEIHNIIYIIINLLSGL